MYSEIDMDDDFDATLKELGIEDEKICEKMDEDLDYAFALVLQSLENGYESPVKAPTNSTGNVQQTITSKKSTASNSLKNIPIVHGDWEVIDPNPDIQSLFIEFNDAYFWSTLGSVVVRWSPRMTLCAGICCYEGRGGLCSIRLSQPLLKFRPRRDLVETLLHEMIHAYLFVTNNNRDRDGHGPEFLKHMNRINEKTGANITVYHSFHDEVDHQRKHWWKCNGPCQHKPPYFGMVKRAMNRAPSERDPWWSSHKAYCGGTFIKIKEPENYGQKSKKAKGLISHSAAKPTKSASKDISNFFQKSPHSSKKPVVPVNLQSQSNPNLPDFELPPLENIADKFHTSSPAVNTMFNCHQLKTGFVPFSGKGYKLSDTTTQTKPSSSSGSVLLKKFPVSSKGKTHQDVPTTNQNLPTAKYKKTNAGNRSQNSQTGILNRHSGSKTIVLNKKVQKTHTETKDVTPKRQNTFSGTGHVLQENSTTTSNIKTSPNTEKQKSLNDFFTSNPIPKKSKQVVILSSDSEEEEKIAPLRNKPSQPANTASQSSHSNSAELPAQTAPCPVCSMHVKMSEMNSHLDECLNQS